MLYAAADPERIQHYHAHVYYDPGSRDTAAELRRELEERFEVKLGRWHDQPVGPHPISMYQVVFASGQFARVVPFLMLNRRGLTILVHPLTGDDCQDHIEHALWLGQKLDLDLSFFKPAR